MALGYNVTLRNNQLDEITGLAGASALLRIYDGARPATGGAATTLLSEQVCNATFAPAASGGVLTLNAIANEDSILATNTATWFRIVSAAITHVMDGDVGVTGSGEEMELNSVSLVTGGTVAISSATITAGNA